MNLIDEFVGQYTKRYDYYIETGRICAKVCETNMEQMGIRTIVTSRAKKPERLRNKLEKRNLTRKYDSFESIYNDIADLSGVRIALYFPGDLFKVQQFIESNFRVKECKAFPASVQKTEEKATDYKKRFSGYWAMHYRVYLKESDLPDDLKKYADTLVEIQVASALMHAWAEVEHDLVYKPFSGELSYEEFQILDELNGLVLAGEIALQRLQKAVRNRVSQVGKEFNNHYEVAMFLNNKLGSGSEGYQGEITLGRVDLLFKCIKDSEFNKPENLKELLVYVNPEGKNGTIVDQIMDKIREQNPVLYENYITVKQSEELKYQMDTLQMNRDNGNRQGEANTLANIGFLYSSKENYEEALQYFMKAVKINNEIGGIQGEANQLLNLGSTYRLKGDKELALEHCNQALKLHKQISYKQGQANALGTIGNIYSDYGNYKEALRYYNEALEIFQETNYKIGESIQLINLGTLYGKQKDAEQALSYFQQALELCKECEYKQGEGDALLSIGNIYAGWWNLEKALEHYEKALAIQDAAGNPKSKVSVLLSIGKLYEKNGKTDKALEYLKEALEVSSNIEYKNGKEEAQELINSIENRQ